MPQAIVTGSDSGIGRARSVELANDLGGVHVLVANSGTGTSELAVDLTFVAPTPVRLGS